MLEEPPHGVGVEEPLMALSRSAQMARIRGADTSPERVLGEALRARGLVFDERVRTPVGRPDIVVSSCRVAVFIDGCFWHGCPTHYVRPRTRTDFWSAKLVENTTRDRNQTHALEALGWRVVRVWEHEVFTVLAEVLARIERTTQGEAPADGEGWRVVRVELLDPVTDLERRHMVSLSDPPQERFVDAKRYTTKWKRRATSA